MTLHRPSTLAYGLFSLGAGVFELAASGHDSSLGVIWVVGGVVWTGAAFRERPAAVDGVEGPGSLRATPARRFRATGWPPAKDADAYR